MSVSVCYNVFKTLIWALACWAPMATHVTACGGHDNSGPPVPHLFQRLHANDYG